MLIDRTDKLHDVGGLEKLLATIKDHYEKKAEARLVIGVITGKSSDTSILIDRTLPENDLLESAIKLRRQKRQFIRCLEQARDTLLQQNQASPTSAIVETLQFVAEILQRDSTADKRLIIYSDMVQNSQALSFYGSHGNSSAEQMIKKIVAEKRIPELRGIVVDVAGAGGNVSEEKAKKVKDFWKLYFEKANAKLRSYGPVLTDL